MTDGDVSALMKVLKSTKRAVTYFTMKLYPKEKLVVSCGMMVYMVMDG